MLYEKCLLNPFYAIGLFLYPLKTSFWCFQGVLKETSGMKWVNKFDSREYTCAVSFLVKSLAIFNIRNQSPKFVWNLQINSFNLAQRIFETILGSSQKELICKFRTNIKEWSRVSAEWDKSQGLYIYYLVLLFSEKNVHKILIVLNNFYLS